MSDTNVLTELANFRPRSPLASDDDIARQKSLDTLLRSLTPQKPVTRRVTDLMATVMMLSARTRRMVMPKVEIDLDVFAPNGTRALRMHLPQRD